MPADQQRGERVNRTARVLVDARPRHGQERRDLLSGQQRPVELDTHIVHATNGANEREPRPPAGRRVWSGVTRLSALGEKITVMRGPAVSGFALAGRPSPTQRGDVTPPAPARVERGRPGPTPATAAHARARTAA